MAKFTFTAKSGLTIEDNKVAKGTLDVYGLGSNVLGTTVNLKGLSHTYASDLDMLLVSPNKSTLAFLTDAGGASDFTYHNLYFSDSGAPLIQDFVSGGTYHPVDLGSLESGTNWGLNAMLPIHHAANGSTFYSEFGNEAGNGIWSLLVRDDMPGIVGSLAGWGVTLTTGGSVAALTGGGGADTIKVITTDVGTGKGVYSMNNRGSVAYEGVTNFNINGNGGDDKILTDQSVDYIRGGAGKDYISAGANYDQIFIYEGDDVAGETYDGGVGYDMIVKETYQDVDLRDDTVTGIESVYLKAGGKLQINAQTVNGLQTVSGGFDITHPDSVEVTMGSSTYLNLGGKNVSNMIQAGDKFVVLGDKHAEVILGSQFNDVIKSAGGKDLIITNLGVDKVDGGKGSDTVSYADRTLSVNVKLDGKHEVKVKVDGVAEDKIKNVENVTGGTAGDTLVGDKLANKLVGYNGADLLKGNAGNDMLNGGMGADTVAGGSGNDQFQFSTNPDAVDHIKDFSHVDDTIVLENFVFAAFSDIGSIRKKHFVANASGHDAHTANQKLIFDKADHSLWYDADGNGAGAAVQLAIFDNGIKNLDHHDFLIV